MTELELQYRDKIISVPLLDNRVISMTITQKHDNIEIIFGCMNFTHPSMPVSRTWFNSQLEMGDDLLVSVKKNDEIHVSPQVGEHVFVPYKETNEEKLRIYHSLKKRLENAGMLCLIVCMCLLSCNKADTIIYQNKAFEDICLLANTNNSPFCIVLSDSTQILSKEYFTYLRENYEYMTGKAIYNRIDVNSPENEWYVKWLYPVSMPLTCVFSADGTLMDLIPGAAKETFLYSDLALKKMTATDYHCPNRFQLNKKDLIFAMNTVLQSKIKLDKQENASPLIDSAIAKVKYPYSLFIKLQNESKLHDSLNMHGTFSELLSINDPYALIHYAEEFTEAKKIMDPEYDVSQEPFLEVVPAIIDMGNCKYRECKIFYITLKNRGKRSIKVSDVETSCSCVTNLGDKKYEIAAFDSIRLSFNFTAEQKGEIERGCYFISDARNPVVDVKILATVRDEQAGRENIK